MTDPRITKEMIEAAAMRMAQLELPDSHTLDDRLNAPWYRHTWQAEQVLEAAFALLPEPEWEYGIFRPASMPDMSGKPSWTQIVGTRFFTIADAENALKRVPSLRDKAHGAVILRATRRGPWHPVPDTNEGGSDE